MMTATIARETASKRVTAMLDMPLDRYCYCGKRYAQTTLLAYLQDGHREHMKTLFQDHKRREHPRD